MSSSKNQAILAIVASASPASDEVEKHATLAERLRAGGPFQAAAYRSWAATMLEDPEVLDVVMALIEGYDRQRQEIPLAPPRPRGPGAHLEQSAARDLLVARGRIRELERQVRELRAREAARAYEASPDEEGAGERLGELLEGLGLSHRDLELGRARLQLEGAAWREGR